MVLRDAAGVTYTAVAVAFAAVAVFAMRRRAHNPTVAVSLALVMLALGVSSLADAVAIAATDETAAAVASLVILPGVGVAVGALLCLGRGVARPQWQPGRLLLALLLVEPVLIGVAAATNPLHLWVYRGEGAAQMTASAGWGYGPAFVVHSVYCYAMILVGIGFLAWGWTTAPAAFRRQRLTFVVAAVVGGAANLTYLFRGLGDSVDPTPFGFAVAGGILAYAIFRRDLFTLSPVARALIVDQIGDAIIVLSPSGTVVDLNLAAVELVRSVHPELPRDLVGRPARTLFSDQLVPEVTALEVVSAVDGRRTSLQLRVSPLLDRSGRALGQVYVARDVTAAHAQSRRLRDANTRLLHQVETIEGLRAELAELASRDSLTGMHNRRHMVDRFPRMVAEAESAGESLAVVLLDVDLFKAINDDHGHLVGDAVLVALAHRIQAQAPPRALVARWGGEEFFIALPGTDAAGGLALADEVRSLCEREPITAAGHTLHCTLSGGVAVYPASGTTTTALFQAADAALSAAKYAGRNTVHLHRDCVRW